MHEHLYRLRKPGGTENNHGHRRVTIWVNHHAAIVAIYAGTFPDGWMAVYGDGPHPERHAKASA